MGERRYFRSHYLPRTRSGWLALVLFVALFALAQPPVVTGPANHIDPKILGLPFLYVYVSFIYCAMVCVLIWARWRNL